MLRGFRCVSFVILGSLFAIACAGETRAPLPALENQPFVAIPRDDVPQDKIDEALDGIGVSRAALVKEDAPKHFYLAIHKSQLHERWFLSAYIRQAFPGGVFGGAARSVDTRVVTFREQNGKLFMIDADTRKHQSDLFDPTILIDAFPIITDHDPFESMPGSQNYVLIDPAAGLNQFSMVGDLFGSGFGFRLDTELSFVQGFRNLTDGMTYEQVFTAYFAEPDTAASELGENPFRLAGTLGMSLRKYKESEKFVATPMPAVPHFFSGASRLVPNTGGIETSAAKWAIHEGMEPIQWKISREVLKLQADPRFADYDVVGSIKSGIESWNQAFGFEVLKAEVAEPEDDMAQDDTNMLIVDLDPSAGFAFANWRTNPETGEIRGASVYLSAVFLDGAHADLADDEVEPAPEPAPEPEPAARFAALAKKLSKKPKVRAVQWSPMAGKPLCDMHISDLYRGFHGTPAGAVQLTKKEKVERTLSEVVAHEIGHTLGLRHNFKGSLVPPSTSVMEYQVSDNAIEHPKPGVYDIAAVKYLYGLSEELPDQPFCTDGDYAFDATCAPFDRGADPLVDDWVPFFDLVWGLLLDAGLDLPVYQDMATNAVLGFVRSGATEEESFRAYSFAIAKGRAPVAPEILTENNLYGPFADRLARTVLARLYLDPPELRGDIKFDPPADPGLIKDALDQIQLNLLNVDKIRSFQTRLTMIKILKKMQNVDALGILLKARTEITAELAELSGPELLVTQDLLSHIDRATSPYFE